jgi:hypothetical protein
LLEILQDIVPHSCQTKIRKTPVPESLSILGMGKHWRECLHFERGRAQERIELRRVPEMTGLRPQERLISAIAQKEPTKRPSLVPEVGRRDRYVSSISRSSPHWLIVHRKVGTLPLPRGHTDPGFVGRRSRQWPPQTTIPRYAEQQYDAALHRNRSVTNVLVILSTEIVPADRMMVVSSRRRMSRTVSTPGWPKAAKPHT